MSRLTRIALVTLAVLMSGQAVAKSPFSLINFRRSNEIAKSSKLLTEENGPWMIFVAAFAGEGAEAEARQLVERLRSDFKMKAYLHRQNYDYTNRVEGKGFDKFGNPKSMRFKNAAAFEEIAVLVGDFASVDDEELQKQMKTLKYATAEELALKGSSKSNPTTRRFAGIKSVISRKITGEDKRRKGPMRNAFATRNPMIPRDAMVTKGLDPWLIGWNKSVKHSLLNNPGKYSIRVASFRGQVIIDQKKIRDIEANRDSTDERIDSTDEKAETLTKLLRSRGVEAWVYHDHHESIVTVGSFEEIGTKMPNGTIELQPKVAQIIENFGPSKKPLSRGANAIAGVQPKSVDGFLFDIAPQPILVPRKSIGADYLSTRDR